MKFYEINGKRNLCGDRIREARQKRRLSQSDLCKLLQLRGIMVERDVISRMESGSRIVTDFEAVAIAEVLEVPRAVAAGQRIGRRGRENHAGLLPYYREREAAP